MSWRLPPVKYHRQRNVTAFGGHMVRGACSCPIDRARTGFRSPLTRGRVTRRLRRGTSRSAWRQSSCAVFGAYQRVETFAERGIDVEEVCGDGAAGLAGQELCPRGTGSAWSGIDPCRGCATCVHCSCFSSSPAHRPHRIQALGSTTRACRTSPACNGRPPTDADRQWARLSGRTRRRPRKRRRPDMTSLRDDQAHAVGEDDSLNAVAEVEFGQDP